MDLRASCTHDGVKVYPMHKHKNYEIMLYLEGEGCLRTNKKNYSFCKGSIIIVPPDTEHGSASENGFKNISIEGDFGHLFYLDSPMLLCDNDSREGTQLAKLIYNNRYGNKEYLSGLCMAYIYFLLQNMQNEDSVCMAVNKITAEITENAFDYNISLKNILLESGYSEDYIRAQFKKITGKTPNEFLSKIRIDHACFLINIYGGGMSLSRIAEQCGYVDYVYFSKKFKAITGMSPNQYKLAIE